MTDDLPAEAVYTVAPLCPPWAALWKIAAKQARHIAALERSARFERAERDDAAITRLADRIFELNARIAALEAAIDEALRESGAGVGDWRTALKEVRDGG